MKDEKNKTTLEVQGMDTFRRVTTLFTLITCCISIVLVFVNPKPCESNPHLQRACIVTFSVQLGIFCLLLLHYIGCGCCLRKVGGWLGIFYFVITGLMTWVQYIFL